MGFLSGGILGGFSDLLFGKVKTPELDMDQLTELLKLGIQENRYDQQGLFTSQDWDADKQRLVQTFNPQLQGGMDAMYNRVNQGTPGYPGAGRFEALMNAYESREPRQRRPEPERRERPEVSRYQRTG
jgi:hypothetical protein